MCRARSRHSCGSTTSIHSGWSSTRSRKSNESRRWRTLSNERTLGRARYASFTCNILLYTLYTVVIRMPRGSSTHLASRIDPHGRFLFLLVFTPQGLRGLHVLLTRYQVHVSTLVLPNYTTHCALEFQHRVETAETWNTSCLGQARVAPQPLHCWTSLLQMVAVAFLFFLIVGIRWQ